MTIRPVYVIEPIFKGQATEAVQKQICIGANDKI